MHSHSALQDLLVREHLRTIERSTHVARTPRLAATTQVSRGFGLRRRRRRR